MIIFNKKFEDIEFQDIEGLVSRKIGESEVLDYKESFSSKEAAKLISALANTYGGFIIYGVKCNRDTNEPENIINLKGRKLDDTIDSICYDNITPPVFCESKYLYNSKKSKTVFIVKISESDLTPHAIENNTTVYIKVKGQKRPLIEKADLDKQEWLKQRKNKSIEFRNVLLDEASKRITMQAQVGDEKKTCTTIKVVPKFPKSGLIEHSDIRKLVDEYLESFQKKIPYTLISRGKKRPYNAGVCSLFADDYLEIYMDFNCHGLCVIRILRDKYGSEKDHISLEIMGNLFFTGLRVLLDFLHEIPYVGSANVILSLSPLRNTKLHCEYGDGSSLHEIQGSKTHIDNELNESYEIQTQLFEDGIKKIMIDFFSKLAFLFGAKSNTIQFGEFVHRRSAEAFEKTKVA